LALNELIKQAATFAAAQRNIWTDCWHW